MLERQAEALKQQMRTQEEHLRDGKLRAVVEGDMKQMRARMNALNDEVMNVQVTIHTCAEQGRKAHCDPSCDSPLGDPDSEHDS